MAGFIGADNQFRKDFNHPSAGLQGTLLAVYKVFIYSSKATALSQGY